jgi:hypothetical protein
MDECRDRTHEADPMSRVRFPAPLYSNLTSRLLDANGLESCAIAYAHHDAHSDTWIVVDASPVPEDAYEHRACLSAVLKPSFLVEVANRSRVTGMAVIAIHTHPATPDILASHRSTMPARRNSALISPGEQLRLPMSRW